MLKQLLTTVALLHAACAFATVDANLATLAELDSVQGMGADLSQRIIGQRDKAGFVDWPDLINRVHGMGNASAARFSAHGLTVNGKIFPGMRAPPGDGPVEDAPPGITKADRDLPPTSR